MGTGIRVGVWAGAILGLLNIYGFTAPGLATESGVPVQIGIVRVQQYAFGIVMNFAVQRPDGQNWNGQTLTALQNAPLGWVNARNEVVRNFQFQKVSDMEFSVNGKKLPFIASPGAGDVDYWTVRDPSQEKLHNLDQVAVVWKASKGKQDTLIAFYKGVAIKPIYGAVGGNSGIQSVMPADNLSPQAIQSLLSIDEPGMGLTPQQKTKLLDLIKSNGLQYSREQETVPDYVKRFMVWVNNNCFYSQSNADLNPISFFENKAVPGNCNKFGFPPTYIFRLQGIPTQVVHGPRIDGQQGDIGGLLHTDCLVLDESSKTWIGMPAGLAAITHGRGFDMSMFTPSRSLWFSSYMSSSYVNGGRMKVTPGTTGPMWQIFEGPNRVTVFTNNADPSKSWSKEIKTGDPMWIGMKGLASTGG